MPFAIPAWRNLVPDSDFLVGLFEDPMSEETQHHLIYAQIEGQETDGTIPLSSQLSLPAQFNSFQTTRVEASHTGVLRNQRTYVLIADSLAQVVQSIPKR